MNRRAKWRFCGGRFPFLNLPLSNLILSIQSEMPTNAAVILRYLLGFSNKRFVKISTEMAVLPYCSVEAVGENDSLWERSKGKLTVCLCEASHRCQFVRRTFKFLSSPRNTFTYYLCYGQWKQLNLLYLKRIIILNWRCILFLNYI